MLSYIFILYQPTRGPGIVQRMGWQSWDVISMVDQSSAPQRPSSSTGSEDHTVDWWNVTKPEESVDLSSLPLDVWSPLLPHDTGCTHHILLFIEPPLTIVFTSVSEIKVVRCVIDPEIAGDICAPDSTSEQDAIKGNWVRVPRNLNLEGGYMSGYLVCVILREAQMQIMPNNFVEYLLPKDETTGH